MEAYARLEAADGIVSFGERENSERWTGKKTIYYTDGVVNNREFGETTCTVTDVDDPCDVFWGSGRPYNAS